MVDGDYQVINQKYLNKYNLLVVRINSEGQMVNSRPCYNCLDMLKSCGIKNIYYSTENGIICEKVNSMISINSSTVTRYLERVQFNAPITDKLYYINLLKRKIPKYIKKNNLNMFITYNFKNELPYFKWELKENKIIFYDNDSNFITSSFVYI